MLVFKKIFGRLQRWHEKYAGAIALRLAPNVTTGRGCSAGYSLRLRSVMGGRINLGQRVSFDRWVDLYSRTGVLEIGSDCHFGKGCVIVARDAITIGPGCQVAERVTIRDQDHRVLPDVPLSESGFDTAPIEIGANVWIGAGVTITKGVTIGDGAIIGAGAVVTRDIGAGMRAVGVPAKPIAAQTPDQSQGKG